MSSGDIFFCGFLIFACSKRGGFGELVGAGLMLIAVFR